MAQILMLQSITRAWNPGEVGRMFEAGRRYSDSPVLGVSLGPVGAAVLSTLVSQGFAVNDTETVTTAPRADSVNEFVRGPAPLGPLSPAIDPATGALINPVTGGAVTSLSAVRRTLLRQNVSNSLGGIVLPVGVQRVRISYAQRVGGTTATGAALRYVVGAISSSQAAQMLADTTARNTLVLGREIDVLIDPVAASGPVRLDYLTTTAETGHSTLTVEYWVPPYARECSYLTQAPCAQIAGDTVLEALVGTKLAALNANLQGATPWANAGYVTVPNTSGDYSASWSAAIWDAFWSWSRGEILLVLMTAAWSATPGSSVGFFGNVGASGDGFRFRVTATGLDMGINTGGVAASSPIWTDASTVFDGNDHAIGIVIDASNKVALAAIDDILVMSNMDYSGSNPSTPANPTKVGRSISGGTTVPTAKYRDIHVVKLEESITPDELLAVVSRYAVDPGVPLTEGLL